MFLKKANFKLVLISRFLLKSLLQYQSVSEADLLPTPSTSSHQPVPVVALTSGPSGTSALSVDHNLVSGVPTLEEGLQKKPKKERRERGKENGKEEGEDYGFVHFVPHINKTKYIVIVGHLDLIILPCCLPSITNDS